MKALLTELNDSLGLILTTLGIIVAIIEKSKKIPLAPITKVCQYIGKVANQELNAKVDQVIMIQDMASLNLKEMERSIDANEMDRIRYTVLRFESDLRNLKKGEMRTQEEFITIFDMISKYDKLVKKNRITNNKFTKASEYINKVYEKTYENIETRAS